MNKAITNIKYNHLNQPTEIDFGTKNTKYIYTATGIKLQTKIYEDGKLKSKTDYSGAFVYENDELSYTNIQGGRIINNQSSINNYQYYLTDHLGNVRVTFTKDKNGNAEIIQEDHYYPFGMQMSGQHFSNTELINKYLYNGKEQQEQTNYYDYGFRQMDAQLGRWHVVDAMAENFMSISPYAYTFNDPINHTDLLGLVPNSTFHWWGGLAANETGGLNNYSGGSLFGGNSYYSSNPNDWGSNDPMTKAYETFAEMGGEEFGGDFGDWYAHGGRAGMSLDDYVAVANEHTARTNKKNKLKHKKSFKRGLQKLTSKIYKFVYELFHKGDLPMPIPYQNCWSYPLKDKTINNTKNEEYIEYIDLELYSHSTLIITSSIDLTVYYTGHYGTKPKSLIAGEQATIYNIWSYHILAQPQDYSIKTELTGYHDGSYRPYKPYLRPWWHAWIYNRPNP